MTITEHQPDTGTDTDTDTHTGAAAGPAATEAEFVARVQAFALKVAGDQGAAANAVLTYLGDRLGMWRTLAGSGPVTSAGLAGRDRPGRAVPAGVAVGPGGRGLPGVRPAERDLHPAARARRRAVRRRQPGRPGRRLRDQRGGVGRRGPAGARLHHRRGAGLARARPAAVQRGRAVLPAAVRHLAGRGVAAGRGRAARPAPGGHPGPRRRVRPRGADHDHGGGLPGVDLRRGRLPRRVDPARHRRGGPGGPQRQHPVRAGQRRGESRVATT